METVFSIVFVLVLLSIPLFLGRSFYRALLTRKRIEEEMHELTYASARVVGLTKRANVSESDFREYFAIVEYETPENGIIWAETQPCNEDTFRVDEGVDIACRPGRERSVMVTPNAHSAARRAGFEKNIELALCLFWTSIVIVVAIWYHGFALGILGAILIMLVAGFALGYVTRGVNTREERLDAKNYERTCNRLIAAQDTGTVPAHLSE